MKKIFLLAVFCLVSFGYAQNRIENDSLFLKNIKVEHLTDSKFDYIQNALISWDFSALELNNTDLSIEVITIYDCFNGEQASDFKQEFTILSKDNFSLKGSTHLIHLELMAKCFKWRLVKKETEIVVSDWFYFSFVK
jgi:hypothetical protein